MQNDEFVYILGTLITKYRKSFTPIMSSREFATRCNLSKTTITDLEKHNYNFNISVTSLNCIAEGMGIELEELMETIQNKKNVIIPPNNFQNNNQQDIIAHLKNNSTLFKLFNEIKDWDQKKIKKLHSIALDLEK